MIKKPTLLRIINLMLFLAALWQAVTGLGYRLFRMAFMEYDLFQKLHFAGGVFLLIMAIIHITLNWHWLVANYFRRRPKASSAQKEA